MSKLLHKSIGLGAGSAADPEAYAAYMQHFAEAPVAVLRDCLELKSDKAAIPVDQVSWLLYGRWSLFMVDAMCQRGRVG